ncbi:MAG: hypothetical protein PHQ96_06910 [Candidatus Omnitrophica bacterium]|nr:hypothetical protein [Candidatus Omnitrophota bacterium]
MFTIKKIIQTLEEALAGISVEILYSAIIILITFGICRLFF